MKPLYFILIIILTSCSVQQKASRKITWLKQHNYLTSQKDTIRDTIKEYRDTGSVKIQYEVDSITKWQIKDSCFTKERVEKILTILKVDTLKANNEKFDLKIFINKKGQIEYDIQLHEIIVEKIVDRMVLKDCPKKPWWDKFYIGIIATLLLIVLVFILFGKKT